MKHGAIIAAIVNPNRPRLGITHGYIKQDEGGKDVLFDPVDCFWMTATVDGPIFLGERIPRSAMRRGVRVVYEAEQAPDGKEVAARWSLENQYREAKQASERALKIIEPLQERAERPGVEWGIVTRQTAIPMDAAYVLTRSGEERLVFPDTGKYVKKGRDRQPMLKGALDERLPKTGDEIVLTPLERDTRWLHYGFDQVFGWAYLGHWDTVVEEIRTNPYYRVWHGESPSRLRRTPRMKKVAEGWLDDVLIELRGQGLTFEFRNNALMETIWEVLQESPEGERWVKTKDPTLRMATV